MSEDAAQPTPPAAAPRASRAPAVPRPRAEGAEAETTYTRREHAVAAEQGAYGPSIRSEHVLGAWAGAHPDRDALTRTEMIAALETFRTAPLARPDAQRGGAPLPKQHR